MSSSIFDWLHLAAQNVWLYGGGFLLVLGILVFVHEWGHYIVARMNGVKVESFSIGFGKEIFGWNDKNGTRWKFSYIPLGGYVKLYGDVDPASAQHTDIVEGENGQARQMTEQERAELGRWIADGAKAEEGRPGRALRAGAVQAVGSVACTPGWNTE